MTRLYRHERFLMGYFVYVAAAAPFFVANWPSTWILAAAVSSALLFISRIPEKWRTWAPLPLMLAAYREMNWFTPSEHSHFLEVSWVGWDRALLDQGGLRASLESLGFLLPAYLELCYLLVYAVAPVSIAILMAHRCERHLERWWLLHLMATLGCYALFPYFPSEPPRTAFPDQDLPRVTTWLRSVNLAIVGSYGIHSSVFPSAHVASALSAAWGLLAILRRRRWIGWAMAAYGVSVAVATVYGRYHYAVDALAGAAMTLPAWVATRIWSPPQREEL